MLLIIHRSLKYLVSWLMHLRILMFSDTLHEVQSFLQDIWLFCWCLLLKMLAEYLSSCTLLKQFAYSHGTVWLSDWTVEGLPIDNRPPVALGRVRMFSGIDRRIRRFLIFLNLGILNVGLFFGKWMILNAVDHFESNSRCQNLNSCSTSSETATWISYIPI